MTDIKIKTKDTPVGYHPRKMKVGEFALITFWGSETATFNGLLLLRASDTLYVVVGPDVSFSNAGWTYMHIDNCTVFVKAIKKLNIEIET